MTAKKASPRSKPAHKKTTAPKAAAKRTTRNGAATKNTTSRTAVRKKTRRKAAARASAAKATSKTSPKTKAAARKAPASSKPGSKQHKSAKKTTSRATNTAQSAVKRTTQSKTPKQTARGTKAVRLQPANAGKKEIVTKQKAPAAALPKRTKAAAKNVRVGRLMKAELQELPTEDVWGAYRRAVCAKPLDEAYIEDVRNVLMELHYPLVRHIAERLLQTLPRSIELDDLVSAGLFGLMDAIRGFDPERGIKFKTYCTTRIRGSILDQLRSQDWVPRLVRLKAGRIEKALHKLQGQYGREPTHAELASHLEMDHTELSNEMTSARAKTMFSLSERWDDSDDDGSLEKVEILEDRQAIDPVGELNKRDLLTYVTRALTHKERFIIEQYYQVGHTMREIGEMLALTESRVCQIHSNVMSRLKGLLGPQQGSLLS